MAAPDTAVFEARDELIVSPNGDPRNPSRRTGYFLKPSGTENPSTFSPLPSLSSEIYGLDAHFNGWHFPQYGWIEWTDRLLPKHRSTWERAGILEAILNATYRINKYEDLIVEVAKKWRPETNTFEFGFGEATVTLEDVSIIAGYPLLGRPVCTAPKPEDEVGTLKAQRLEDERLNLVRARSKKASHCAWLKHFSVEKRGDDVEHEAFLTMWLARFVFPSGGAANTIRSSLFPLAIKLARGTMFAIGPAVLAGIYRDLTFLRNKLYNVPADSPYLILGDQVPLSSPFQILLVWIWERFPLLQPVRETLVLPWMPRQAHWHNSRRDMESESVRASFESGDYFRWRPYATGAMMGHSLLNKWYSEHGELRDIRRSSDEAFRSFTRCLRPSELVGLDHFGTVFFEQYLPHRVARQFGYDQDIPGCHPRQTNSLTAAWKSYEEPAGGDMVVYFPSRSFVPGVTGRYSEWWAGMKLTERVSNDVAIGHRFFSNVDRQNNADAPILKNSRVGEKRRRQENYGVGPGAITRSRDRVYEKVVLRKVEDLASQLDHYYKRRALRRFNRLASGSQVPRLELPARGERSCPPGLRQNFWATKTGIEIINLDDDEAPEEIVIPRLEGVETSRASDAIDHVLPYVGFAQKYGQTTGLEGVDGGMQATREEVLASCLSAPPGFPRKYGQTTDVDGGTRATREDVLAGDVSAPPGFPRKYCQTTAVDEGINDGMRATREELLALDLSTPPGFPRKYSQTTAVDEGINGGKRVAREEEELDIDQYLRLSPEFSLKYSQTTSLKNVVDNEKRVATSEGLSPFCLTKHGHSTSLNGVGDLYIAAAEQGLSIFPNYPPAPPPGFTQKYIQLTSLDKGKRVVEDEALTDKNRLRTPFWLTALGQMMSLESGDGRKGVAGEEWLTAVQTESLKVVETGNITPKIINLPPPPGFTRKYGQTTSPKIVDSEKSVNTDRTLMSPPRQSTSLERIDGEKSVARSKEGLADCEARAPHPPDGQTTSLDGVGDEKSEGFSCAIQGPLLLTKKYDHTASLEGKGVDDGRSATRERGLGIGFWRKWVEVTDVSRTTGSGKKEADAGLCLSATEKIAGDVDAKADTRLNSPSAKTITGDVAAKTDTRLGSSAAEETPMDVTAEADTRLNSSAPKTIAGAVAGATDTGLASPAAQTIDRGAGVKMVEEKDSELLVYIAETGEWCDAEDLQRRQARSA